MKWGGVMRVIVSAGGTGGHIYPALAIIHKIKENEPNSEFLYIGTHNRMEKDIVPKENIPFKTIEIYGLSKNIFHDIKAMKCFYRGYKECKKIMKDFNPDVVIGVGGYVTAPVIYAAAKLDYKTFIHEQNSIPGKANIFLSKYATRIGVSFLSSIHYFPEYKTIYTGNPCSDEAVKATVIPKDTYGLNKHKKLVLIVMGSLGAGKVNEFLIPTLKNAKDKNYEILFITGKSSFEEISKHEFPKNVKIASYVNPLTGIMKEADVLVSRAGASTISEMTALKIPTVFIPSPYVPNNHQYKNAIDFVKKDAALLLEEKNLEENLFYHKIEEALNRKEELQKNLEKFNVTKSSSRIYSVLCEMVDGKTI